MYKPLYFNWWSITGNQSKVNKWTWYVNFQSTLWVWTWKTDSIAEKFWKLRTRWSQSAQLLGKARMYQHLPTEQKKGLHPFPLRVIHRFQQLHENFIWITLSAESQMEILIYGSCTTCLQGQTSLQILIHSLTGELVVSRSYNFWLNSWKQDLIHGISEIDNSCKNVCLCQNKKHGNT